MCSQISSTEEQLYAFALLQYALTCHPVIKLPEWHKPFTIDMDACDRQVGCALFQLDGVGVRKPIGFWSQSICNREKN